MNARGVDQHNLACGLGDDSLNPEASGLRFIGDGGNLLSHQSIEQSRFARVGPSNQGDEARVIGLRWVDVCQWNEIRQLGQRPKGHGNYFPFSANICTKLTSVSVVFSKPRRELNSNLP